MSTLPASATQRDPFWDNAKGILILCVIFAHVIEQGFDAIPLTKPVWTLVYSFHMPAFLMVSGYMTARSSKDPADRVPKMLGYYLVMTLINAAMDWIESGFQEFTLKLLTPRQGLWYLLFLAYAYLTAHYLKGKDHNKALIIAGILALVRGFDPTLTNQGGLVRFASFLIFFLIGYDAPLEQWIEKLRSHQAACLTVFVLLDGTLFLLVRKGLFNRRQFLGTVAYVDLYKNQLLRSFLMQPVCFAISLTLTLCLFAVLPRTRSLLSYIGQNSLWLYLGHVLLVRRVYRWFALAAHVDVKTRRGAFWGIVFTGFCMLLMMLVLEGIARIRRLRRCDAHR